MSVSPENTSAHIQAGQSPAEMLQPVHLPDLLETATGLQIPAAEVQAIGAGALEHAQSDPTEEGTETDGGIELNELAAITKNLDPDRQANILDAVKRTRNPELKRQATERNSHISLEDIWQDTTLHHSTSIKALDGILKNGHLGFQMDKEGKPIVYDGIIQGRGDINFGVPRTDIGQNAGHQAKLKNLSYYGYGSHNDGIYLHYTRPVGSYREGEEYMEDAQIKVMPGGMPATELNAITMDDTADYPERVNTVRDALVEAGMYAPIFTQEGELAYSREAFDADMEEKEAGRYVTETSREEQRLTEQRERAVQMDKDHRAQEARKALELGMSIDEYKQHQTATAQVQNPDQNGGVFI